MPSRQQLEHWFIRSSGCLGMLFGAGSVIMLMIGIMTVNYNTPAPRTGTECIILSQNVTCNAENTQCSPSWTVKYLQPLWDEYETYDVDDVVNQPSFDTPEEAWEEARNYKLNQSYPCYYRHVTFMWSNDNFGIYFQEHQTESLVSGGLLITIAIMIIVMIFGTMICCEVVEVEDNPGDVPMQEQYPAQAPPVIINPPPEDDLSDTESVHSDVS